MTARRSYPKQVDATTCGIAALAVIAARAGTDPGYLDGDEARIHRTQLALHELAARSGLFWPKALGTSPWALASLARRATGVDYRLRIGSAMRRAIDASLRGGVDVFAYTGGSGRRCDRLIPRHVIAILADHGDVGSGVYGVFEPSSGRVIQVPAGSLLVGAEDARPALGFWHGVIFALTA